MSDQRSGSDRASVVRSPTRSMMPILVAATVLTISTNSMITVLLPDIGRSLGSGPVALGWTVTGALLGLAIGSPVYGFLGLRFGIRAVLAAGLVVFTAGVAIAAVSPNITFLIAARGLQGIGAGAVPTLAGYAVVTVVEPARRGAAFGLLGSATGAAQVAGPVVGGTLGEFVGWRGVFTLAGLIAVPLAVASLKLLPRRSSTETSRSIDVAGVVLLAGAVSALLAAINLWGQPTASQRLIWTLLVLGAVAALGLVWRSRTAREPFIPPALLRRRGYVPACTVAAGALGVSVAVEVLIPLQVSDLRGLESGVIGLVLLPGAVVAVAVAAPAGRVADRVGNRAVAAAGVLSMVVGVMVLSSTAGSGPIVIATGMATTELGFVVTAVAAQNAAGRSLDAQLASVGFGLFHTARYLSGGIGAALGPGILEARGSILQSWNPAHHGAGANYADTLLLLAPVLLVGLTMTARIRRD
ncbi:DHA2 family florfenicol/chloramphenicol resistance protein-like MFS transporter [Amycolatopsis arida]|nr:DHA2 family florfenicol/chloramphenicol resistance protein-like MFS transporter [Amycolatopsis arida]